MDLQVPKWTTKTWKASHDEAQETWRQNPISSVQTRLCKRAKRPFIFAPGCRVQIDVKSSLGCAESTSRHPRILHPMSIPGWRNPHGIRILNRYPAVRLGLNAESETKIQDSILAVLLDDNSGFGSRGFRHPVTDTGSSIIEGRLDEDSAHPWNSSSTKSPSSSSTMIRHS